MVQKEDSSLIETWCTQVFKLVEKTQDDIAACRKDCRECKEQMYSKIADLDKRLAINSIKIAVIVGGGIILIQQLLKVFKL